MPNQYEIKNLKNSIDMSNLPDDKDEHSVLMEKIKSLVKKNVKDLFVEKILDTQMVSNMVCKWHIIMILFGSILNFQFFNRKEIWPSSMIIVI